MTRKSLNSLKSLISLITLILPLIFSLISPPIAEAKRLLPRVAAARGAKTYSTTPRTVSAGSSRGVTVRVRFRSDRRAIIATFTNLAVARRVDYALTYKSRGKSEGVVGNLDPSLEPAGATRELLFATCSGGVCRHHSGLGNARFTVTTTLKNNTRIVKPFRLRV